MKLLRHSKITELITDKAPINTGLIYILGVTILFVLNMLINLKYKNVKMLF